MRKSAIAMVALAGILAGCTTQQGALVGGATGAAIGGLATDSLAGAIVGAGVGALAGAVLVQRSGRDCYYRYRGKLYRERCP